MIKFDFDLLLFCVVSCYFLFLENARSDQFYSFGANFEFRATHGEERVTMFFLIRFS